MTTPEDTNLSEKELQYLKGESEIEPRSPEERHVRMRIRNKVKDSIGTLSLAEKHLEERDIRQIVDSKPEWIGQLENIRDDDTNSELGNALVFLYRLSRENLSRELMEQHLERMIEMVENEEKISAITEVNIDTRVYDADEVEDVIGYLLQRERDGESPGGQEIGDTVKIALRQMETPMARNRED